MNRFSGQEMSESARKRRGSKIAFSGGHRNSSSGSGGEERGISSSSDGAEGRLGCLTVGVSQIAIIGFMRQVVLVLRLKEVRGGGCDPGVSGPGAGRGLCQGLAGLSAAPFEHFLVRLRRFRMARADFRAQRSATSAVAGKAAAAEQKQAGTDLAAGLCARRHTRCASAMCLRPICFSPSQALGHGHREKRINGKQRCGGRAWSRCSQSTQRVSQRLPSGCRP